MKVDRKPIETTRSGAAPAAHESAEQGSQTHGSSQSEAKLRSIIESSDDIVFEFDEAAAFVNVWARDETMLVRPKAELLGRRARDVLDPEFVAPFEQIFRRVLDAGRPESVDYALEVETGMRWFSARIAPLREPDGARRHILMFVRDVTERKRLDGRVQRLAAIVEATTDFVCLADVHGSVLYVNQAGRRLVGIDADDDLSNLNLASLVAEPGSEEFVRDMIPRLMREGSGTTELPLRNRDGLEIPTSQVLLAFDEGTEPGYLCIIARDLTERDRFEEELRQSQKMEAIGRLAGGIAHDFNNLLSVVQNYARFVMDEMEPGDPSRVDLEEIVKAGQRGAKLTEQLLAFSRRSTIVPKIVNINTLISSMHRLLSGAIHDNIRLSIDLCPQPWRTKVDPGHMEQVLLNLAINAQDAMPQGGKLHIRTFNMEVTSDRPSSHPRLAPGRYVCLEVGDTGSGMSRELQERIFEPFFTTKPAAQGSGLGLASVYGIISQAGGRIHVESEEGRGSTFTTFLPEIVGQVTDPGSCMDAPRELPSARGETILVVEDEEAVRKAAARVLTGNGYRVLQAASGSDALELLHVNGRDVDLLLTDVVMPGMSGPELAYAAGLRTVFMSGYSYDVVSREGLLDEGVDLIYKPFSPNDLLEAVGRSLGRRIEHHALTAGAAV